MFALPWAATAGVLVKSPDSDSMGSSGSRPATVSCRCTLCRFLVVSLDSFSSVAASGRALLDSLGGRGATGDQHRGGEE